MTNNKLLHVSAPDVLSSGCLLEQGNTSNTPIISVINIHTIRLPDMALHCLKM